MNIYDPNFEWKKLELYDTDTVKFALVTKAGAIIKPEWGSLYVCAKTGHIMGKWKKAHWAKGRIVQLISNLDYIAPGEYMIDEKEGFSYGYSDTLRLKRHIPVLDTARKAANWADKQIAYQEAMDGLTTEAIAASMKVL